MNVGYIQTSPIFGDKHANFEQVKQLTKNVKADLLVLPELFATGYTFTSEKEAAKLAEDTKGETAQFLCEISKQTGASIVAGFVEKDDGKIYNSSLIITQGKVIATYRKAHLFNKETLWFSPGNTPFSVYELNGVKVGVMICFDWIFPEVTRTLALKGAYVIAHPANLVMPFCQAAMVTRCLENRVFAVTCNRIGEETRGEDGFKFTGASQITAYNGEILASASKSAPEVKVVKIDTTLANNKSVNAYNNVFFDRRKEYYQL